jgi:HEAT repeats
MNIHRRTSFSIAAAVVVLTATTATAVNAQAIARAVSQVRDGKVRVSFAARPEVCGWGNGISRGGNNSLSWSRNDYSPDVVYDDECTHTPVRLVLGVEDGKIRKVRTYVGGRWRNEETAAVVDAGTVSVKEATDYLLNLAATDEGSAGRDAIVAATLADSVMVWPRLLRIARDDNRPRQTKQQALFWIGQAAADKVSPPEMRDKRRGSDEEEIKKQAVFALSQRRKDESVPALIRVARENRDPEVRKSALFWLGQTGDSRAISLFEEILGRD